MSSPALPLSQSSPGGIPAIPRLLRLDGIGRPTPRTKSDVEDRRRYIVALLVATDGNRSKVARAMGLSAGRVRQMAQQLDVEPGRPGRPRGCA